MVRRLTRLSPSSARRRCRPISPRSAHPTSRTPAITRPCSRPMTARWRPRRRVCISHPPAGSALPNAASPSMHRITLHVGAGTFLPVKADDTAGHKMHAEWGTISAEVAAALNAASACQRRPHRRRRHHLAAALGKRGGGDGTIAAFAGDTAIFITPGYRFRAVDLLLTNFHLPRSTLFMLVSAFSRARRHETRLRPCEAARLPLLFLWRRLPADREELP
jgi:hypothetical protein